jgi:isopenicillin-N epimerase
MQREISRRSLLIGSAAAAGAVAVGYQFTRSSEPESFDYSRVASDWEALRASFELDPNWVHMAGLLLASHPTPVKLALEKYRDELDKNPAHYYEHHAQQLELGVRQAAARYLNGDAADIALTDSTTMGLGLLYSGLKMKPDQEILTTEHDHSSTHASLAYRSQRTGNEVKRVRLYGDPDKASVSDICERLATAITPATRVIAVTYVHSSTGVRLPISAMAEVVAKANSGRAEEERALLCVDAVHGFASTEIDLQKFGADFLVAGCHKWLFGPRGTGVLWGRREVQEALQPTIPTFSGLSDFGALHTPGGFHSFEHRWALKEAFDLHFALKPARVEERIHELNRQAKEELSKLGVVRLYTPMSDDLSAGLICFDVNGFGPREVVTGLKDKSVIASNTPYRVSYARITPSLLNNSAQVEETIKAIRAL